VAPNRWEGILGARGWGHLYRSSYRSKTVRCPGEIRRFEDGSWECVTCAAPCSICEGGHPAKGDATKDPSHGELRHASVWTLKYWHNGEGPFYERTRTADWNKAQAFRRRRFKEIFGGDDPWMKRRGSSLSEILELVLAHYRKNKHRSINRQIYARDALLGCPKFMKGAIEAASLTETAINDEYVEHRQAQRIANDTINTELQMLRQAYRMAYARRDENGRRLITQPPVIKLLAKAPPREGFFEAHSLDALLAAVRRLHERASPADLADLIEFYWMIGWRNAAARHIERTDIDWFSDVIVLRRVLSKNGDPVTVPFGGDPELKALLQRREKLAQQLDEETGHRIPWLFFRTQPAWQRGKPFRSFRRAWLAAMEAAGLNVPGRPLLTPHSFRRSAARDGIDSGADPLVVCDVVGWNDIRMLKRYRILAKKDRERAVKLRADYRREQREAAQLALPFVKKGKGGD
jgi:site-specific recombinase XerD